MKSLRSCRLSNTFYRIRSSLHDEIFLSFIIRYTVLCFVPVSSSIKCVVFHTVLATICSTSEFNILPFLPPTALQPVIQTILYGIFAYYHLLFSARYDHNTYNTPLSYNQFFQMISFFLFSLFRSQTLLLEISIASNRILNTQRFESGFFNV